MARTKGISLLERQVVRRGFVVAMICCLWNLVGDLIYSDMTVSGDELLSLRLPEIVSQNKNSHSLLLIAQTAGWMYPIWGVVTAWQVYLGLRKAGFWFSTLPCCLMAYSFCVIGGAQHSGWAFLTVLWQSPYRDACLGEVSTGSEEAHLCRLFFDDTQARIWRHFIVGDFPALLLFITSGWVFLSVAVNQTKGILFPHSFNLGNPLVTQVWVFAIVYFLPAPYAGIVGGPFGTWMVLSLNVACAVCLWNEPVVETSASSKKQE